MYADTETALEESVGAILMEETTYPQFVDRFKKFYERRNEWVLLFRQNLITRGNNTNNYAEATIRILKDVVLNRTKAYNVVALVEFSIMVWDQYLTKKLLHFAYMRNKKPYLLYSSLCAKMKEYNLKDVIEVEENIFLINCPTNENMSYVVNGNIGVCTCYSGNSGALCKHQCFLIEHQKIKLPNALPVNKEERYLLAYLALGRNKCPEPDFFDDLKQPEHEIIPIEIPDFADADASTTVEIENTTLSEKQNISEVRKCQLLAELDRIKSIVTDGVDDEVETHLLHTLQKVKGRNDLKKLTFFRSAHKRIDVQPTSIARRRKGLTKTKKRVPAGRPPKINKMQVSKRKHCLKENIVNNVSNSR